MKKLSDQHGSYFAGCLLIATRSEGVDRPTLQSEASVSCKGSKNNEVYVCKAKLLFHH